MKPVLQRTLLICSSASLLLSGAITSKACDPGGVTIINLPPLAGSAYQPYALNSQGQVSGSLFISGVHAPQAFLYSNTGLAQLGTLGGATSFGFAINSSGQVVGQADLAGGTQTH